MARYRTEIHIPIKRDDLSFEERQLKSWDDVETQMQQKRSEWEKEFEQMRNQFFTLTPAESGTGTIDKLDSLRNIYEYDSEGRRKFKVRFEVSEFRPEEIEVKVQDSKLIVHAKHEEKKATSTVSREYSRQVDIPRDVDQDAVQCVLSKDGVLTIEGPVINQALSKETFLPIKCDQSSPMRSEKTPLRNPIITEPDGSRKLSLNVDIGDFKPEEVVVKTMDRKLVVTARHEEKSSGRTMQREFNKEYELPESVDPMSVNAFLADDGKLTIEAPLKSVARQTYAVTQSQDVRKVVVTKESSVTITDSGNRPMVTINVHRH